jgi:hypothetical protein
MAALVIKIEEFLEEQEDGGRSTGFKFHYEFENLQIEDMLPGLRPLIMRSIHRAIDAVMGDPYEVCVTPASKAEQDFIN